MKGYYLGKLQAGSWRKPRPPSRVSHVCIAAADRKGRRFLTSIRRTTFRNPPQVQRSARIPDPKRWSWFRPLV